MTKEAADRLTKALERAPGIEKRIVERQPGEKAKQGRARLAEMCGDIASALSMLGGGDGDTNVPTPDGSWGHSLKPKDGAIEGRTFTSPEWMKAGDRDLVDCTFTKQALHHDQIAKDIRLFNPTFKDLVPYAIGGGGSTFGFYINMGKKGEQRLGFVIAGGRVIGLKADEFMETKDFDPYVDGLDFTESPGIEGGFRIRHGAYAFIGYCKGLKSVTMRGHHHVCVECPDAVVDYLAGDLPGEFSKWLPMKKAGKGNYQRAEFCFADGVKQVRVGYKMQSKTPMGAAHCMVGPGQKYELLEQEGFEERSVSSCEELWKIK